MQPTILLAFAVAFVAAVPALVPATAQQDQIQLAQPETSTGREKLSTEVPIVFHPESDAHLDDKASSPVQLKKKEPQPQEDDESILDQLSRIFRGESLADPTTCFCAGGTMCCPSTGSEKLLNCNFGSC